MAIEIVDFPIKNCDFPWQNVSSPEGKPSSESSGTKEHGKAGKTTQKKELSLGKTSKNWLVVFAQPL